MKSGKNELLPVKWTVQIARFFLLKDERLSDGLPFRICCGFGAYRRSVLHFQKEARRTGKHEGRI